LFDTTSTGPILNRAFGKDKDADETPRDANVDRFASYCRKIMQIPNLEADEERELVKRWRENDDDDAYNKLLNAHLKLALSMASKHGRAAPLDDLMSAGTLGLVLAANAFDPDKGARLSTYARHGIEAELKRHFKRNLGLRKFGIVGVVEPGAGDKPPQHVFLNEQLDSEDDDGDTWQDRLSYDGADVIIAQKGNISQLLDHREEVFAEMGMARHSKTLNEVVNSTLNDDRERYVFRARHLIHEPVTRQELSSEFGVSSERIRQIEDRAFEKVQRAAKSHPQLSAVGREI